MVFIAYRASGVDFDVDSFVAAHAIPTEHIWRKGMTSRPGHMPETSGFSLGLPDADTTIEVISILEAFLEKTGTWMSVLRTRNAEQEFDLGMTVGERDSYVPVLNLPTAFLVKLGSFGIDLTITGYPTSNND